MRTKLVTTVVGVAFLLPAGLEGQTGENLAGPAGLRPPVAFQWPSPPGVATSPAAEPGRFVPASLGTNAGLRRELFLNLPGVTLADLTNHARFPGQPDLVDILGTFETPSNSGDDYGVRVSGYLVPPASGNYKFYLSANGQAALFLSLDEHPEHRRAIAFEPLGNGPREWTNGVNQASRGSPATNVSGTIQLVAGQAYYVEALMKAGAGDDNLGVAWQSPSGIAPANGAAPIAAPTLALSPPTNSLPTTGEAVPELAAIDYEMLNYLRAYAVNSGLIAVMRDGRIILRRGYGWHDKRRTRPISPDARFRFASNVKGMTAAATKQLMGRGLFQTNTAILPYLGLQPYNNILGDARLNQITVYHCLTHQGGWNRNIVGDPLGQTLQFSEALGLDHPATRREHLEYLLGQALQFNPGTQYTYSNVGFMALGQAIEKATGRRWLDVLEREVLRPWGVNGFQVARSPEKLVEPDEPYYVHDAQITDIIEYPTAALESWAYGYFHMEAWDSAGGVMGSAEELLRYAQAYVVGGRGATEQEWYRTYNLMGDRRLLRKGVPSDHGGLVIGSKSSFVQRADGIDWAAFYCFYPGGVIIPETVINAALDRVTSWPGDNAPRIELASDSFRVDESEGALTIGVKRTGESTGVVSAAWTTIPGSAMPGVEFTTASGVVTFGSNEITAVITIPILDDTVAEAPKTFMVTLTNPTGSAQLGVAAATITIEDDDNRQPPAVAITSPLVGALFPLGTNVSITASPADADGTIYTVTYHAGPTLIGEENKPPYTFVWKTPAPGAYLVTARAVDNHGLIGTSAPVVVTVGVGLGPALPGTVLREFWNRRPATVLSMLTNYAHFPSRPTGVEQLDVFEISPNRGDYYGTRISGFVHPPTTGQYVFWIAADEMAQLWLSTDDNPGNKRAIAAVTGPTGARQWTSQAGQQSGSIQLSAGRRYYIEAIHKESITSDHLAVGWQLPDSTLERPIPGARLSPNLPTGRPFVASVMLPEGDNETSNAVFVVSLNGTNAQPVTVNYTTFDGTALAGSDYTATDGSLTFNPGELTKTFAVPVHGDPLGEPNETFFARLIDLADPHFISQAQGTIVADDLYIAQHPQDIIARAGSNVTLSAMALSPRPISYQWRLNGSDLSGRTDPNILLTAVQLADDGNYTVAVGDGVATAVSDAARLLVLINPVITQAPLGQSVVAGGSATFSVAFTGNPMPFGVEWRRGSFARASNTLFAAQDFFRLTNAQPTDAATWRVIVKNQANTNSGTGENRSFTLTVLADSDSDGLPDVWELAHGFPTNNAANAALDSDGDGLTDGQEYQAGTNPTNALSYLKVDSVALTDTGGAVRLTFLAVSNTTYTVQSRTASDTGPWMRLADVVAASTNRVVEVIDAKTPGLDARYYQLATPRVP